MYDNCEIINISIFGAFFADENGKKTKVKVLKEPPSFQELVVSRPEIQERLKVSITTTI